LPSKTGPQRGRAWVSETEVCLRARARNAPGALSEGAGALTHPLLMCQRNFRFKKNRLDFLRSRPAASHAGGPDRGRVLQGKRILWRSPRPEYQ
jgi:hypothetical protein